ncbi:MAG: AmmeMemoRadiSam system radical SAM enzyme [Brevinematales bacterium]|nr:AmmeMemoRadiSam system radical SAM enzyme [Brevinematales bacterium]
MKEALFFNKIDKNVVQCLLCPHNCIISDGKSGICGARKNINGTLYTLNYGVVEGLSLDPIEKKPLYHYYPGKIILSVGTLGCNLKCPFCQNSHLSRFFDDYKQEVKPNLFPEELLLYFLKNQKSYAFDIFPGIAYTYSEPLVWYEFLVETAEIFKKNGYKNILVTNGYVEKEPLSKLLPFIDAANVDLKAFTEENYRKLCGGLKPVQNFIETLYKHNIHIEVTTLVVTDFNDNLSEIESIAKWISSLDKKIPFHLSRYFPSYLYQKRPTDLGFLDDAEKIAREYLYYVYKGNVLASHNTYCPECGNLLIQRRGYDIHLSGIKEDNRCNKCSRKNDIIL